MTPPEIGDSRPAPTLDLVLFATEHTLVKQAMVSGIRSLIVDLEWRDKHQRQQSWDTEINQAMPEDLETLRQVGVPHRYCRLDRIGPWTDEQVETVLTHGATHVMLPMVETASDAEAVISRVDGRAQLGILVETQSAVDAIDDLATLPLDAVYVGLNDLAISRRAPDIWRTMVDGTVDRIREALVKQAGRAIRFGVAGVTVIDGGRPIPARLLLAELARLECDFSFLRRSFRRDIDGRDWHREVKRIQDAWRHLADRSAAEVARDRRQFVEGLILNDGGGGARRTWESASTA